MAAMEFILSKEMRVSQPLRSHSRSQIALVPLYDCALLPNWVTLVPEEPLQPV